MKKLLLIFCFCGAFCCLSFSLADAPPPVKTAQGQSQTLAPIEKDLSPNVKFWTISSIYSSGIPASNDLFGNKGGGFAFHTAQEDEPYLIIGFKHPSELTRIIVTNRSDGWQYRANNLELWISDDMIKWRNVWNANGKEQKDWTIELKKESAKYLKFTVPEKKTCLHLAKVKIFGFEKPVPSSELAPSIGN